MALKSIVRYPYLLTALAMFVMAVIYVAYDHIVASVLTLLVFWLQMDAHRAALDDEED